MTPAPAVDAAPPLPTLHSPVRAYSARVLSVPLDPVIVTRHYRIETIEMVVLRATDGNGAEGLATLWCFGLAQAEVLARTLDYLAPFALRAHGDAGNGRATEIAAITGELRREINFFGFKGVSVFALSAFDMALTDLACLAADASLGHLLGRRRDSVPAYWSGLFGNQSRGEILDEVDQKLDEGFRAMKLRVGNPSIDEDVARVAAVLARLPASVVLILDAVQSWTVEQTLAAVERMEGMPLRWLEDPLVHNDYAGLARVVEASPIPIAWGENEYLADGFDQVFAAGPRYLLADLERVGGISEWRRVAARAHAEGAVLTPHVYPHIALQLCAALEQDETWIEYIGWWDSLSVHPLKLEHGRIAVPDHPGTGLVLDPDHVEACAVGPWRRLDD